MSEQAKPRVRVKARRDPGLVLVQAPFRDASDAARHLNEWAARVERAEITAVVIIGHTPDGAVSTSFSEGHPRNRHLLIAGCMNALKRLQDSMEW